MSRFRPVQPHVATRSMGLPSRFRPIQPRGGLIGRQLSQPTLRLRRTSSGFPLSRVARPLSQLATVLPGRPGTPAGRTAGVLGLLGSGLSGIEAIRGSAPDAQKALSATSSLAGAASAVSRLAPGLLPKSISGALPFVGPALSVGEGAFNLSEGNTAQGAAQLGGVALGALAGLAIPGVGPLLGATIGGIGGGFIGSIFGDGPSAEWLSFKSRVRGTVQGSLNASEEFGRSLNTARSLTDIQTALDTYNQSVRNAGVGGFPLQSNLKYGIPGLFSFASPPGATGTEHEGGLRFDFETPEFGSGGNSIMQILANTLVQAVNRVDPLGVLRKDFKPPTLQPTSPPEPILSGIPDLTNVTSAQINALPPLTDATSNFDRMVVQHLQDINRQDSGGGG